MTLIELKNSIVAKQKQKPWIFTGIEIGVMEIYINQLARVFGAEIKRVDKTKDAIAEGTQKSLFGKSNKLFVVRNDKEFVKDEAAWDAGLFEDVLVVLVYPDIDKRTTFSKHFAEDIVEFQSLNAVQLSKYIIKDTGLESGRAEQMAINCGLDYLTCKMESDKLIHFAKVSGLSINSAFDEALKQKVLWVRWEDLFNDFVEDVMARKTARAISRWRQLKELGETEMKALAFIYTQFKNLLIMLSGGSINPYFANQLRKAANSFSLKEVEEIIYIIQKSEQEAKTGRMEMGILLEYILVSIG